MDMNLPGGIPEEDLPEPIRRMLQEARAKGDKVHILPIPKSALPGIISQAMEVEGDDAEDDEEARLQCGCGWCQLESKLVKVRDTDQLTVDQKYEAADRLFKDAAEAAQAADKPNTAFSMRMQGMMVLANQRNRQWILDAAVKRREAILKQAAERYGIDATDEEAILARLAGGIVDSAQNQGSQDESVREMLTGTAFALLLKDMTHLINTLESQPPDLKVVRVEGAQLAQFI